ncbi:hypothetical protein 2209_scaffold64_00057 [Bacteriophage sp.]|nr:hypothetical protein 2209_scaffold64_00057 [Bacteriophage sp.]
MEQLQHGTADHRRHDHGHQRRELHGNLHAEEQLPMERRKHHAEERELEYREGGGQPLHLPRQHDTGHHDEEQDHHGDAQRQRHDQRREQQHSGGDGERIGQYGDGDGQGQRQRKDHHQCGSRNKLYCASEQDLRGDGELPEGQLRGQRLGFHHRGVPFGQRAEHMGGGQQQDDDHQWRELSGGHHRQEPRHLRIRREGTADLPAARLLRRDQEHEQLQHQQRRLDELRHAADAPARHPCPDAGRSTKRHPGSEQADLGGQPEQHHQHHGGQAVSAERDRDFRQRQLFQERRGHAVRLLQGRQQQGEELQRQRVHLVGALSEWQRLRAFLQCQQRRLRRLQLRELCVWRGLRLLLLIQHLRQSRSLCAAGWKGENHVGLQIQTRREQRAVHRNGKTAGGTHLCVLHEGTEAVRAVSDGTHHGAEQRGA